jgi:hypothetical protein
MRSEELERAARNAKRGATVAWLFCGLALASAVALGLLWSGAIARFVSP